MTIDSKTIQKIAHLARLEFHAKDEEAMIRDMNEILTWVEKLNELDTDAVEPLTNMSYEINRMREDEVKPHLPHEDALKNAPDKDQDYFRVPKVLK
jgi:aspartyl-tRNA(Asn)/glutamyl-tRNA(Gln) amidotransferase subunit C